MSSARDSRGGEAVAVDNEAIAEPKRARQQECSRKARPPYHEAKRSSGGCARSILLFFPCNDNPCGFERFCLGVNFFDNDKITALHI